MTTNAYLFGWDCNGLDAIIPISKYEDCHWDKLRSWNLLKHGKDINNPFSGMLFNLKMRARFNTHRNYQIYAVDCSEEMTEEFWETFWEEDPKASIDLITSHGVCISV